MVARLRSQNGLGLKWLLLYLKAIPASFPQGPPVLQLRASFVSMMDLFL